MSESGNHPFSFAKPQKQLIIDSKTDGPRQQYSLCASIKQNCVPDIFSEIQFLSRFGTLWSHLGWSQLIFSESFWGVWECLTLQFRTHILVGWRAEFPKRTLQNESHISIWPPQAAKKCFKSRITTKKPYETGFIFRNGDNSCFKLLLNLVLFMKRSFSNLKPRPNQIKNSALTILNSNLNLNENQQRLKVPHMGWDEVAQTAHPLWEAIPDNGRFYFVQSYYVRCDDVGLIAGEGNYGVGYDAALAKENLFAVQFHPEKSAANGLRLLTNFLNWKP